MTAVSAPALPVNQAALIQRVTSALHNRKLSPAPVILVEAAPHWPHDVVQATRDGTQFEVVVAGSVLAVWEQVLADRRMPRVILTPVPEEDLGTGLLSHVVHRCVFRMEPWALVAESFGAQRLDPRLAELRWAGPALLDATPPRGWPPLAGSVLQRDLALRWLTAERLRLERIEATPDDIDASVLLRWSMLATAQEDLDHLVTAEREGLLAWLAEVSGPTGWALGMLAAVGHVTDLLPLGLVCGALWDSPDLDPRAQGRVEQYLGAADADPAVIRGYGTAAEDALAAFLGGPDRGAGGRTAVVTRALDRAEDLLTMFSARTAAGHSRVLPTGFAASLSAVASGLRAALKTDAGVLAGDAVEAAASAARRLTEHVLAGTYPHRVTRAEMAVRLLRWLDTPDRPTTDVGEAIDAQIADWSWVDVAAEHVWTGDDAHPELSAAYQDLFRRVRDRRKALDASFAEVLARWVAHPTGAWPVESILGKVVEPVVRDGDRGVLLVVLDGMTAAAANDLGAELTGSGWLEYDPGVQRGAGSPRRRGVVSGIPSVTVVSRTSLLTGTLRRGDQNDERTGFERHPLWKGRTARLFHDSNLRGDAGGVLHPELLAAISEPETIVGVVINTIDDSLEHGRESADAGWRVNQLGVLRTLLDHASYQGRAVILTSDHGHVLERGGELRAAPAPASARHRTDAAPPGPGEIELAGPRVLDGGNRIVALHDADIRYLPRKAGYHGGATLAEVTVPVIALLPLGATPPPGWRPLGGQEPAWWNTPETDISTPLPPVPVAKKPRKEDHRVAKQKDALFEIPAEVGNAPSAAPSSLVEAVLSSEMFQAQHALTPRKLPLGKVRGALAALVEANGTLPVVLVAQRAGETVGRAGGFLTTLQRILNVDNFPVLSVIDDGRTARLDIRLLRQQFGVSGGAR